MMIPVRDGNARGDVELYPQRSLLFRLDGKIEDGWLRVWCREGQKMQDGVATNLLRV